MSTVAVVGLGAMGSRMARRLLDAGHRVVVWNRSTPPVASLADRGAVAAATPAAAARSAEAVITMVSDPAALLDVTEGPDGVLAGLGPTGTLVQMATMGVDATDRLVSRLPEGRGLLDAPVLGSLSEVEAGTLTIFVGGPEPLFERWRHLLSALGSPLRVGPVGAGSDAKLVANAALLGILGLLGEVIAVGDGLGLSWSSLKEVLSATPLAAQAERRREVIETGHTGRRFALSLAVKDADLILAGAARAGVDPRLLAAVRDRFAEAERDGLGDRDYSTVLPWIRGRRGSAEPPSGRKRPPP